MLKSNVWTKNGLYLLKNVTTVIKVYCILIYIIKVAKKLVIDEKSFKIVEIQNIGHSKINKNFFL